MDTAAYFMTGESWAAFGRDIQQAGADALELNIYELVTDPRLSATHEGPACPKALPCAETS